MNNKQFLPFVVCAFVLILIYFGNRNYYYYKFFPRHRSHICDVTSPDVTNNVTPLKHNVELTLRMTFSNFKIRNTFMCDFLRSAVVFWDASYGPVHLILDEKDKNDVKSMKILTNLLTQHVPLDFRWTFETGINKPLMEKIGKRINRSAGYVTQLYSSFLMDLYTTSEVIAWTDTDTVFTIPVLLENIRTPDGKLIVKGMNMFDRGYYWLDDWWNRATEEALGVKQISDFMVYFPVYLYPDTIKNCRLYIMKRHNVKTFEEAFDFITPVYNSPVSIILTYAYLFERDRYDWHIDIGNKKLNEYNKWRMPAGKPLCLKDLTPSLHFTVHTGYYKLDYEVFERALCYLQINLDLKRHSVCEKFVNTVNYQLFEFCNIVPQNHLDTWCNGANSKTVCTPLIEDAYRELAFLHRQGEIRYSTKAIKVIEDLSESVFGEKCRPISYEQIN